MGLNISKGNMYDFITHTWNTIKGQCYHDCSYCYMKRWGTLKPVRFDNKELNTVLGKGNFIFVGSSCDMFSIAIPDAWIKSTLKHCAKFKSNKYLFQSKDPLRIKQFEPWLDDLDCVICTTIETNRWYGANMWKSPPIIDRVRWMKTLSKFDRYVTIEPIMDFDIDVLVEFIKEISPVQVNIGADSGRNNLPEPSYEKILELASELSKFTLIKNKRNLDRLKK